MTSTQGRRLKMKLLYPTAVFFGIWTASLVYGQDTAGTERAPAPSTTPPAPKSGKGAGKPAKNTQTGGTASGKTSPSKNSAITYWDLVSGTNNVELPYGASFTITGKTTEVCLKGTPTKDDAGTVSCGKGGQLLTDVLTPTSVAGAYIVDGRETPFASSAISGDAWTLTVGKLDENASVTFRFAFSGQLAQSQAEALIDGLLDSTDYTDNLKETIRNATDHPEQAAALASAFGQTTGALVTASLAKRGLAPQNPADLGKLLFSPTAKAFNDFFNIPSEIDSLRHLPQPYPGVLAISPQMSASGLHKTLTEKLKADALKDLKTSDPKRAAPFERAAKTFITDYEGLRDVLGAAVSANVSVQAGSTATDITADLKKYAGFDGGALYVPRLQELRGFATVNIYWGSVALHPDRGQKNWAQERLSLMLGMAVKDLSGGNANDSKIKSNNAFAYGIGFRLNKYFRLNAGGLVYRTSLPAVNGIGGTLDNKLRHELFVGPSIDITAIPALQGIFAKKSSN